MTPTTIEKKLARMRGRLTRWILVDGLGRWLWIGLAVLLLDMGLDRLFKMDFAQRLVMLVVMAAVIGAYFAWRVIRPWLARPSDAALLYEVESEHPEAQQAILSGYQLARQTEDETTGVSPELKAATIQRGNEQASGIQFDDALDLKRNRVNWAILMSGLVVTTLLGLGIGRSEFISIWFNRNVLLLDDQWPQGTYLEIAGVVDGTLVVSRGSDHRQLVTIMEKSTVVDVAVSLEVDNPGGRSLLPMKSTGKQDGREQVFTFHNVSSPFRFRALGGDEVTEWVNVELVEPPSIISLTMQAQLPDYTGREFESLTGNGPHAVLRGSLLDVAIETNKPLREAAVQIGDQKWPMTAGASDRQYAVTLPGEGELQGGEYQFALVDTGGVAGNRKSKFKITIKDDRPPQVRATLLGISGLVVPRAMLPTSYQAADEYGLTELAFDCNWTTGEDGDDQLKSERVVFAALGQQGPLESVADRVASDAVLDLQRLELKPGTSFRFSVAATDNFPDPANVGRSQEFLLRVVTENELRSDLLRREIEQREAFDQAYQKQLALATELQAIGARRREEGVSESEFNAEREANLITAVREQKGIGTAIARVADRFEDFLVEIKNNRLDEAENEIAPDQRIENRFDQKIIQPIRQLDAELVSLASRQLDNCRINVTDAAALEQAIAVADGLHQQILLEMKNILQAMNDSENFQGIINDILEIKRDTESIKDKIDEQNSGDDDIFNKGSIFDK